MSEGLRIAVLGAGGFLGSHLVPALLRLPGVAIDAVDLDLRKLELSDPRVTRHIADVADSRLMDEVLARAEVVLSLTALCTPALYSTNPLAVIDANYTHLVPLVERCAARGKRLVHFSTCEVYGRMALDSMAQPTALMREDETALFLGPISRERWSYACAKQLLERVIWAHGQHGGLDFTIIRPFNVIGPRMDFLPGVDGEGVPRVLACFMNALLREEELLLVDGGEQKRSFISVEEFAAAIVRVIELPRACRGEIINVGNPANDVSIRELGEALSAEFAAQVPHAAKARFRAVSAEAFYGPGYDDSARRIPDISKAQRLLAWQPQLSLAAMLPAIVEDYVVRYGAEVMPRAVARAAGARTG